VDVKYINPFIDSINDLFSTMLNARAKRGEIGVAKGSGGSGVGGGKDVTALIGLSGSVRGMVALSFPMPTALMIACRLLGNETKVVDGAVADAVAECVNIVAGAAKAKLSREDEVPIDLSLPTVIRGSSYNVEYPSKSLWLEVPFTSTLGSFSIRVTLADNRKER